MNQSVQEAFQSEWDSNSNLERVKRMRTQNFASENVKNTKLPVTESTRDVCIRTIVAAAKKSVLDLQHLLPYPIKKYPLSLTLCDGSMVKTGKSAVLNRLETLQTSNITDDTLSRRFALVHVGSQRWEENDHHHEWCCCLIQTETVFLPLCLFSWCLRDWFCVLRCSTSSCNYLSESHRRFLRRDCKIDLYVLLLNS